VLTASAAPVSRSPPSALPTVLGGPRYERRRPEETALWQTIRETWPEFEAALRDEEAGHQLPAFVQREFSSYLDCGLLCRGFAHVKCTGCSERKLVA
jgi:hypothetical protein